MKKSWMIGGSESKPDSEVHEFSLHGAELQRTKFPALFLLFSRWKGFVNSCFRLHFEGLIILRCLWLGQPGFPMLHTDADLGLSIGVDGIVGAFVV
jgi:hypothetical protein